MDTAEMVRLCKAHTMYSWSAGDAVTPLPISGAEGIWFWGPDGRRLLDFNSHVMSVNVGHGHPRVIEAIKTQLDTLPFAISTFLFGQLLLDPSIVGSSDLMMGMAILLLITPIIHRSFNLLGYRLGLKSVPY